MHILKSIFNNDYTELTLEDGRTVGYKTFENVLHLWEGKYESRTAQSFYDWGVIARHFEAMRLLGELSDSIKPLPSMDGQMTFILDGQWLHTDIGIQGILLTAIVLFKRRL